MPRPATVSPQQILDAAALEFAERGYAGARVDRIARRARVNKAMLYYHFGSKQALYRALLRRIFSGAADRLQPIAAAPLPAGVRIERIIAALAAFIAEHAFFPAIMLREVADGGVHLDQDTLKALARVPMAVGSVVQQGVADGSVRNVHPMAAYFTMLAPIVFFLAGEPIRKELAARRLANVASLTPQLFIDELQHTIQLAFGIQTTPQPASSRRPTHHRSSPRRTRL
jgi:TetR/AcrR family transcriptional regulator